MRVYEFAKQKGLSSKDVLALLKEHGFELGNHMSIIPDEALPILEKKEGSPKKSDMEDDTSVESKAEKKIEAQAPAQPVKKVPEKKISPSPKEVVVQKEEATSSPVTEKPRFEKRPPRRGFQDKRTGVHQKITEITLTKDLPLHEVAKLLGHSEGELILALLKKGIVCNRNHILNVSSISDLAHHFGIQVTKKKSKSDSLLDRRLAVEEVLAGGKVDRWPIVVVMGHVDHGKTTLLDYIRNMNVAAKEKGGITQHLSAYEVDSVHGKIVFLDTPGHEAFSYMRKQGASVTDIVVLIIAADDGVMPQTVEVINHAKEADVPIIVAINKVDRVDKVTAIEKVKRQLAQHDLLPEDWGGSIICVPISAKSGEGVEELLEMITLQSQMMELKADPESQARGFILESRKEKGFGSVATVICLNGTIKVGDYFICGSSTGKVRFLVDSHGKRVSSVGPSIPVQVVGFDNFVALGDWLTVVSQDDYLKAKSSRKKDSEKSVVSSMGGRASKSPSLGKDESAESKIFILVKADTHGSKEALLGAIKKINKTYPEIPCSFHIVTSGVGGITEKDVELAAHAGAYILGLHAKADKKTLLLAKELGVEVKLYDIIYRMTEELEEMIKEREEEVSVFKKIGEATVRKVFDLKKRGVIAGCYVSDGIVTKNSVVACMRRGQEIGRGKITSLQRERKTVKEVHAGHECGFITDSFHDWEVDDTVHVFLEEKKKRSEL